MAAELQNSSQIHCLSYVYVWYTHKLHAGYFCSKGVVVGTHSASEGDSRTEVQINHGRIFTADGRVQANRLLQIPRLWDNSSYRIQWLLINLLLSSYQFCFWALNIMTRQPMFHVPASTVHSASISRLQESDSKTIRLIPETWSNGIPETSRILDRTRMTNQTVDLWMTEQRGADIIFRESKTKETPNPLRYARAPLLRRIWMSGNLLWFRWW